MGIHERRQDQRVLENARRFCPSWQIFPRANCLDSPILSDAHVSVHVFDDPMEIHRAEYGSPEQCASGRAQVSTGGLADSVSEVPSESNTEVNAWASTVPTSIPPRTTSIS